MNAMAPPRPTELHRCHLCLTAGPAAAAQARREVRAAVTGRTITLDVSCSRGQLRVDVYDTSCCWPVVSDADAHAETGRGLMLVATLSADWGFYRTPAGKAVFFTLDFETEMPNGPAVPVARSTRRDGAQR
jgi:hypothetical protein